MPNCYVLGIFLNMTKMLKAKKAILDNSTMAFLNKQN